MINNFYMNKQRLKIGLKILAAIGLLGWFLYKSDVGKIFENIYNLPFKVFASAVILNFFYLAIKTLRWHLLLPKFSPKKLLQLSFISQFYSIFSAGQFVGEAAKIYILGKGQKEAGQIAMSVLIDKITGTIGLVIVALFGLVFTPTILPSGLIWTFIAAVIICLISIFSIRFQPVYNFLINLFNRLHNRFLRFKRMISRLTRLIEAWHIYSKKTGIIFMSIILSIIFQLILVGVYMIMSYGLGINISFLDWCWVLGILSGILVLPVTIGGLGLREGSLVGLLGFFLIAKESALALSFSIFGLQLIFAVVGGAIELKRTGLLNFKIEKINTNLC